MCKSEPLNFWLNGSADHGETPRYRYGCWALLAPEHPDRHEPFARLVELMEKRTLLWLRDAFGLQLANSHSSALHRKILTAVRAVNGYWLQLTLTAERGIDIEEETTQLATRIKAIMKNL